MQSGMKTSMMAMHDNVQFILVKLRLKADNVTLDMLKEVRSGFILKMYVFSRLLKWRIKKCHHWPSIVFFCSS